MKKLVVALLFVSSTSQAQGSIDHKLARAYFDQLASLGARDNGRLWGTMVSGPMMFVDPASHEIVANEQDSQGQLHKADGVWIGKLPDAMNPANTAVDFGGKKFSMVMWPVPDGRYSRGRLLMHESFHRIQDKLGLPPSNPSNNHLASAEGRIWTRLEWRALSEALLHTGQARREALADALTFRARRREGNPVAAEEENQLEVNEGMAEYTGLVLSGLPASVIADRAAVALAQNESQESLTRSFAYSSGPAYGALLDQLEPAWRKVLPSTRDLSSLAQRAYHITATDPRRAESLAEKYDGARMMAAERSREEKRIANEIRLRSLFADSAVLKLPVGDKFAFSFDPDNVTPFPGMGTVYQSARISDAWGILDVTGADVLMARNEKGLITSVFAPLPVVTGNLIKGQGWSLTIADGWMVAAGSRPGELILIRRP
jgi:hypothetical protein